MLFIIQFIQDLRGKLLKNSWMISNMYVLIYFLNNFIELFKIWPISHLFLMNGVLRIKCFLNKLSSFTGNRFIEFVKCSQTNPSLNWSNTITGKIVGFYYCVLRIIFQYFFCCFSGWHQLKSGKYWKIMQNNALIMIGL